MSIVNFRTLTGSTDSRVRVVVKLVTGSPIEAGDSASGTVLVKWETRADVNGAWEVSLPPNELVTPAGSYYEVTEYEASPVTRTCTISQAAGPFALDTIAGTVPGPVLPTSSMADGASLALGTTTGTKIGTATTQKLGFYNATPIVRPSGTPANATDLATAQALVNDLKAKLIALGLIA